MKKPEIPKYYVARDKRGLVWLFADKPIKVEEAGEWYNKGAWYSNHFSMLLSGTLSAPEHRGMLEPHWEDDEPLEVAICLLPYDALNPLESFRIEILTR